MQRCSQPPLLGREHSSTSGKGQGAERGCRPPRTPTMEHLLPLKKLTAKPALLMEPSETNFIQSLLEVLLMSSGLS